MSESMIQNTVGRGELFNFLKDDVGAKGLQITKNVNKTQSRSYTLEDIPGPVSDPLMIHGDGRRLIFSNVVQTGPNEAIAEEVSIRQL